MKFDTSDRLGFFDALRGFTMISMALFHGAYDLAYIYGIDMPWFTQGVVQDVWRASISWVFLFVAGWMCSLSHNNFHRALKYGVAAIAVWIATTLASVDDSINFGIIYCMAACTLLVAITQPILSKAPPLPALVVCLLAFAILWPIPQQVYSVPCLAWFGFPDPTFVSGDYYPIIPFVFMYIAGYMASRFYGNRPDGYPSWMYSHRLPGLEALGRHALPFYLIHQPLILAVLELLYSVR